MKAVVQRVTKASVSIDGRVKGEINQGLMILLGVKDGDTKAQAELLAGKIAGLRIFTDEQDKMNLSVLDVGGEALVVSNFTLYGDCKKGKRPSYIGAARPDVADPLYTYFVECLAQAGVKRLATGEFGADMQVLIQNDGPVTLILDTEEIMPKNL